MPTTVNGIGTMYYGKRDAETREDVCENCNRTVKLSTHQTTKYFTICYVPVLPLGKLQILDMCPVCTHHRAIDADEWQAIQDKAIEEKASLVSCRPDDPAAAVEFHSTLVGFNRHAEADELAALLETKFANNPDVLLYVAGWYEHRQQNQKSDALIEQAFKLAPEHPGARRAMGLTLIEQDQTESAAKLLEPFRPGEPTYDPMAMFLLAKGWQQTGDHERALEEFQEVAEFTPEIVKEEDFAKAVKVSEKALGVKSGIVPKKSLLVSGNFWMAVCAVAIVGLVFWINHTRKQNRPVHVVNGLSVPITTEIRTTGPAEQVQSFTVPANGRLVIRLPEGQHQAFVKSPKIPCEPVDFQFELGWFERMFSGPTYVLDPSRSAIIAKETAIYTEHASPASERVPELDVTIAEPFQAHETPNYVFKEFPDSLKTESRKSTITKTRIHLLDVPPTAIVALKPDLAFSTAGLDYLETHLCSSPSSMSDDLAAVYGMAAIQAGVAERAVQFLKEQIDQQQIENVDWHRLYQNLANIAGHGESLKEYYRTQCESQPDSAVWAYLHARIQETAEIELAGYLRSQELDPQSHYPLAGAAWVYRTQGEYAKAASYYRAALKLKPDDGSLQDDLWEAQLKSLKANVVRDEAEKKLQDNPLDYSAAETLLTYYEFVGSVLKSKRAKFQAQADALLSKYQINYGKRHGNGSTDPFQQSRRLAMHLAVLRGESEQVIKLAEGVEIAIGKTLPLIEAYVQTGEFDAAAELIPELTPQQRTQGWLLLALAYQLRDDSRADHAFDKATENLARESGGSQRLASLIAQAEIRTVSVEEWKSAAVNEDVKGLTLAFLSAKDETGRKEYLDHARLLCRLPGTTHRLVAAAIEKWPAATSNLAVR